MTNTRPVATNLELLNLIRANKTDKSAEAQKAADDAREELWRRQTEQAREARAS